MINQAASEEAKDHSPATATDDDEFKSAESRTPPKERYGGSNDGNSRIVNQENVLLAVS